MVHGQNEGNFSELLAMLSDASKTANVTFVVSDAARFSVSYRAGFFEYFVNGKTCVQNRTN